MENSRVFCIRFNFDVFNVIFMIKVEVPKYILENALDALRMAANTLESRKRETAMDRQIEYSERLLKWALSDQKQEIPKWIP